MPIEDGSNVTMHYQLTVDDQVVDTSEGRDPLTYVHGGGELLDGLEAELLGLEAGDQRTIALPPEKAYGEHEPEAVRPAPREAFEGLEDLEVGVVVQGKSGDQPFQAMVTEIGDDHVMLDLNHPLAGKTLTFEVEIVSVA